ncbi:hypothetical protein [Jatrophihabitans sp.]|uniref:hypothetical protein n=1 Tax=Jatrophihabitans sp. TaxID=1932789 RepID=UPI002BF3533A|nr:hypothetical protein [Jatrophihabitans sp.]
MGIEPGFHDQLNDVVRIDRIEEIDSHLGVAMMGFFRRLGISHLYPERIVPTMEGGGSRVYLAARDRPWPPWGLGARAIGALCQVHPVGRNSYAISPVYTADEDATNIGMIAAVYKEALENLSEAQGAEVNYLVVQDSRFADRLLRGVGFSPSDDLQVTDQARYRFYRTEAGKLAKALSLDRISVPELLAHQIEDSVLDRLSGYFAGLYLATGQGRFTDRVVHEIVWIDGGLFDSDRPGLAPPDAFPPGSPDELRSAPPDAFPPGSPDELRSAPPDAFPPGSPDELRLAPPGDIPGRAGIAPPGNVPDWGFAPPGGPPDELGFAPPGGPPDDLARPDDGSPSE